MDNRRDCRSPTAGWPPSCPSDKASPEEAEAIARLALQLAYAHGDLSEQMISQSLLGDLYLRRGKTLLATEAYETSLASGSNKARRPTPTIPNVATPPFHRLQQDGRYPEPQRPCCALENYQASLAIRQAARPARTGKHPMAARPFRQLQRSRRHPAPQRPCRRPEKYQASLAIRQALAQREPENTEWQRDLSAITSRHPAPQRPRCRPENYRRSASPSDAGKHRMAARPFRQLRSPTSSAAATPPLP